MKKLWVPIAGLSLWVMVSVAIADQKVVMEITGMTCQLCTIAVKKSLTEVEGVTDVAVSYKQKQARFTVNDAVSDAMLNDAVQKAGYKGKIIKRK